MKIDGANKYLREALEADDPTEKDHYMRQAMQLLATD